MAQVSKFITLGIDIGGTRIKTVALEGLDKVLLENRIDSHADQGPEAVRNAVRTAIDFYRQKDVPFKAIGLGCAGSVMTETGIVLNSPNFANWKNVPLRDWVQEDFKVPAAVNNDANCAAYTEWKLGNAVGTTNSVSLTFGTGVGGGAILNNRLYTGSTGSAAELGHFSIHADGIQCACGNRGCFERYCSASFIEKAHPGFTAKEVFAQMNTAPFSKTIQSFFEHLVIGVTSIANIFDPDVILLGGGLIKGIAPRMAEIRSWIKQHAFPAVGQHVRIEETKFANQSGAIGAALLVREHLS